MRYSAKTLAGRFIILFAIISVVILSFIIYMMWTTSYISRQSKLIDHVYYPLNEKFALLEGFTGRYSAALHELAVSRDTTGLEELSLERATAIEPTLIFIRENSETFSPRFKTILDSTLAITSSQRALGDRITAWIINNYITPSPDSVFLAELPSREQAELNPMTRQLENLSLQYRNNELELRTELRRLTVDTNIAIGEASRKLSWVGIMLGLLILIVIVVYAYQLVRKFNRSISTITDILNRLVKGEASDHIESTNDELGIVVDSANKLSDIMKRYSALAASIGEGNVDVDFTANSEKDVLGNSLLQMTSKLKTISDEDRKRSWITEGLAKFAGIVRKNDDYKELSEIIITELVKYTGSSQGGLFALSNDENDPRLELASCYAFERKKYLQKTVKIGEGLTGQSFVERRTIHLKEIPHDYVTITSGLGGSNPNSLLIVPLKVNDTVEGVIELASFKKYLPHEIEFVEKVGEVIASTISASKINTRTRLLLEESQQRAEEMRAQEEEMRQNMEEMQATQEQLHRQAEELRKTHENLSLERSMFQVLMEYLADRITYKDRESRILRVNKAKAVRFKQTAEEMIGKSDYDYFAKEHADKAFREEQDLIQSGEAKLNIEERAVMATGDVVWAATSRIPFKNEKGEMIGVFIITKDVTQLKLAESSLMDREKIIQQLLDNMPVFRYSINNQGIISDFWTSKVLGSVDSMNGRSARETLPEVHDLIKNEKGADALICKGVHEVKGEKEIFKHFLFIDSAQDGAYLGFAMKQ